MFKNYLLATWQNLLRQKLFALINILGLSIGLTVFILIFLYVEKEYSWDRQWDNADRIYWMTLERRMSSVNTNKGPFLPSTMIEVVRQNFPEVIENSAQLMFRNGDIFVDDQRFQGNIFLVERELLDIFDLEIISGSFENTFSGPGRVALREELVTQYFGEQNPLGRIITLAMGEQDRVDYQVTAVYRAPEESSIFLGSLSLMDKTSSPDLSGEGSNWWSSGFGVNYFLLQPGVDIDAMNRRLVDLVNTVIPKEPWRILQPDEQLSDYYTFEFEQLADAHFSDYLGPTTVDRNKVLVFALIGVLVMLMGSANFVILATAKAEDRRREVGVRKVLGASRRQLVFQFLNESVLQTCAALVVAVFLVYLCLPVFGNLIGRELTLSIMSTQPVLLLVLLAISVGVLGGLYPAFVLAGFSPVSVFRPYGKVFMPGIFNIRNVLACFQFMIATTLVIATLGVYFQLNYIRRIDPGFSADNLFTIGVNYQERQLMEPFFNAVGSLPGVEGVARSSRRPGPGGVTLIISGNYLYGPENVKEGWSGIWVDYDFFDIYRIPLLAGRQFDPDRDRIIDRNTPAEERENYRPRIVINRTYVQNLGFAQPEEAVGKLVINESRGQDGEILRTPVEIIGVVEDSRFESLREAPESTVYLLAREYTTVSVRYADTVAGTIARDIERVWNEVVPDNSFSGEFLTTVLADEFRQEENEGRLLLSLAFLSIFIASMGLFALTSYTVRKSVKEVGIRKVMGADSQKVVRLFLWRFSVPVLAANLVAWPVSLYVLLRWLQRFPEQIGYGQLFPILFVTSVLVLLIAWTTVGMTTVRAARANPVQSLRYE